MYTPQGLQYILQVYCYYVEVYVHYAHILQSLLHFGLGSQLSNGGFGLKIGQFLAELWTFL